MTVQEPHCPRPHPNLGPRSARSSLSTYSSGVAGSTSTVCFSPLTVSVIELMDPRYISKSLNPQMPEILNSRNPEILKFSLRFLISDSKDVRIRTSCGLKTEGTGKESRLSQKRRQGVLRGRRAVD